MSRLQLSGICLLFPHVSVYDVTTEMHVYLANGWNFESSSYTFLDYIFSSSGIQAIPLLLKPEIIDDNVP